MNTRLFLASAIFLFGATLALRWFPGDLGISPSVTSALGQTTDSTSGKMSGIQTLSAALEFLEALDESERRHATFAFDDAERFDWHFIPRTRPGVALSDLTGEKQGKAKELLRASLSAPGFKTAQEVRGLEAILRETEGPKRRFARDPLLYHVSIFGKPARDQRWAWRFEGHHLSLNFVLDGDRLIASTPAFFGANPAMVKHGPHKGLRVLAPVEDLARSLVTSLDEKALARCLGKEADVPREVPETAKRNYKGPLPAGVAASELSDAQKQVLAELLQAYRRNLADDLGSAAGVDPANLSGVHFAWGGGLKPSEGHSYLIHGPGFVINYSNYQNGVNHIHANLRALKHDFGGN